MCTFTLHYNVTLTEPQTQCMWHQNNYDIILDIVLSQTKKLSALTVHWCSDSCISCSHLIPNYSTVLVQEEQECDWQRLLLQVLWSLQHVQRDCLIVAKGCVMKLPVLFVPNRATLAQWEFVYSMDILCINVECNFGAIECTCQCWVHLIIVYHAFFPNDT